MIYFWKIADNYPETLLDEYDRERGPDRFGFKQGKRCETGVERPRFIFKATVGALWAKCDLGNNDMVPLVSPRVGRVLSEICGDEVQLIPCEIEARDGIMDDYSIVVVTNKVRGLDHEQSSYTCIPGTKSVMRFSRAVYASGCLGELSAARDEEYLSNLLISERLYQSLCEFDGLGLYPESEMSW